MNIGELLFRTRSYTPVPVVLAMLLIPGSFSAWRPELAGSQALTVVIAAGFLVMAAGELIRLVSVAYASPATRTRNVGASRLFASGPYARVRNPLYIGNFLILMGMLIMAWTWFPWLLIAAVVLFVFQYHMIVRLEEKALDRDLGEEYATYKANVPRFIPRLTAWTQPQHDMPDYRKALRSELNSFRAEIILIILIAVRWFILLR